MMTLVVVWLYDDFSNAGNLALAMSISNVFTCIALYNMRAYQVSDVHSEFSDSVYVASRVITCLAATVLCAGFALISGYPRNQIAIIIGYMIFRSVMAFIEVLYGIAHKHSRLDYVGISMIARGFLTLAAFSILGLFFDLLHAIIGMIAVTVFLGLVYDYPRAKTLAVFSSCKLKQVALLLKRCLPLMLVTVMFTFYISYTRYALERMYGTEELGAYATTIAPAVAVQLAASFIFAPLINVFSSYKKTSDKVRFYKTLVISCALIAGLTFIAVIAAQVAGQRGLKLLFGEDIVPYAYLLPSAMMAAGLTAFLGFLNIVFSTLRDVKGIFFGCLTGMIICVAVTEFFLTEYYMIGANYAVIVCQGVVALILCVRLALRYRRPL